MLRKDLRERDIKECHFQNIIFENLHKFPVLLNLFCKANQWTGFYKIKIWGEQHSGLRRYTENQKDPDSNPTRYSSGL